MATKYTCYASAVLAQPIDGEYAPMWHPVIMNYHGQSPDSIYVSTRRLDTVLLAQSAAQRAIDNCADDETTVWCVPCDASARNG